MRSPISAGCHTAALRTRPSALLTANGPTRSHLRDRARARSAQAGQPRRQIADNRRDRPAPGLILVIHRSRFPQRSWDFRVSNRRYGLLGPVLPKGRHSLCGLSGNAEGT
jgi:hypothetical protein